jgi:hypothetical protein
MHESDQVLQRKAAILRKSQDFTYPTTTPRHNVAGTVVDSDVVNHAKSNKTSLAFW